MLEIKKLKSGIRIVLDPVEEVQSVAIGIWVKTGAINEDTKYAGISHFVEHMMFKGTEKRSPREIAADIDKIGGQINAFTGKEATCYHVKTLASSYKEGADVLIDMLENSVFDKNEMSRERKVIEEEIKMTLDSPEDLAHDISTELIFKGGSLGKSIIGTPSSLSRISRNVMVDYVRQHYTRDNIVISVAGKFNKDDICQYFDEKLMKLGEKSKSFEYISEEYSPRYKVIKKDIEQTHICLGMPMFAMSDDRYYDLQVLNNAVGGTMSSRMFQNIRENKGLAYSVFSMAAGFNNSGYFKIYAGVASNKVEDAIEGIREELDLVSNHNITEEELRSSREQLKATFMFGQENTAARMFTNGKAALLLDKVQTMEDIIEKYDRVSLDSIDKIKEKVCDFRNLSAVAVTGKDDLKLRKFMKQ